MLNIVKNMSLFDIDSVTHFIITVIKKLKMFKDL